MNTVFMSLFELIEASRRVHRFNAMSFSMRQQKLDKFCWGYKVLRPRLTKHCRGRVPGVPGGVDAYDCRRLGMLKMSTKRNLHESHIYYDFSSIVTGNSSTMSQFNRLTHRNSMLIQGRPKVVHFSSHHIFGTVQDKI